MCSAAVEADLASKLRLGERVLRLTLQCARHETEHGWALQQLVAGFAASGESGVGRDSLGQKPELDGEHSSSIEDGWKIPAAHIAADPAFAIAAVAGTADKLGQAGVALKTPPAAQPCKSVDFVDFFYRRFNKVRLKSCTYHACNYGFRHCSTGDRFNAGPLAQRLPVCSQCR